MREKRKREEVDGVILFDKAASISSNHALQAVRNLLGAKKAGHTGTLDPFATGLMILCFGEATKYSSGMFEADKSYIAEVRTGFETDTADYTGQAITEEQIVSLSQQSIQEACERFVGTIQQVPPMYSALKFQGQPLYRYARQGVEIERTPRTVHIYAIELLSYTPPHFSIRVQCSKGTYIRSLAQDIGRFLGCGAHVSALRRTETAGFMIENAMSLESLTQLSSPRQALLPVDCLVEQLPACTLDAIQAKALQCGQEVIFEGEAHSTLRVYDEQHQFLGTASLQEGKLRPQRLLAIKDKT